MLFHLVEVAVLANSSVHFTDWNAVRPAPE